MFSVSTCSIFVHTPTEIIMDACPIDFCFLKPAASKTEDWMRHEIHEILHHELVGKTEQSHFGRPKTWTKETIAGSAESAQFRYGPAGPLVPLPATVPGGGERLGGRV